MTTTLNDCNVANRVAFWSLSIHIVIMVGSSLSQSYYGMTASAV